MFMLTNERRIDPLVDVFFRQLVSISFFVVDVLHVFLVLIKYRRINVLECIVMSGQQK